MRKRSLIRILAGAVALSLSVVILAGSAGADTGSSAGPQALSALRGLRGGLSILKSRSFQGADGHLYTTSDLKVNGSIVRGVTAPGGRVGDRWEWVESLPLTLAQTHNHDAAGLPTVEPTGADAYAMQSGEAAGSSLMADASTGTVAAASSFTTMYGYGWCSSLLDAPYRINGARSPGGAVDAIRAGFNMWTNHSSSWMSFAYKGATTVASSARDGINSVFFLPSSEGFLGRTWVYGSGTHVVGFDMQLNSRYPITVGSSGYDLQTLVAHEAGHAAGFGHSSSTSAVMYGGGQAWGSYKRSLTSADTAALLSLYPYGNFSAKLVSKTGPATLGAGKTGTYTATFQNLGKTPWAGTRFAALRLRTAGALTSPFAASTWPAATVPARSTGAVCKNDQVTMTWTMHAPTGVKLYSPSFVPVVGPQTKPRWLTGSMVNLSINVTGLSSGGGGGDGGTCFIFCW
jgi:hypothetical protein